ncbi:reverse transcriptase domain-containing protein, partial [Tanacetum coccineum]
MKSFSWAGDVTKISFELIPHHVSHKFYQLVNFYNALDRHVFQDSLNSATGGNLLERSTQDVLTIIENKSKPNLYSCCNNSADDVLCDYRYEAIRKQFSSNPPPASCLAADGNTFTEYRDNIRRIVAASSMDNYNQGNAPVTRSSRFQDLSLRNTVANTKGELKAIITRSGLVLDGLPELKCKALADLGANINLMPLSVWKKLGLPKLISTQMTLELANYKICTPVGIARDVLLPFLRTACALIDVHGEEMILWVGNERLILNMRHDTSSYSNEPHQESINMIDVYNVSHEEILKDLFTTNHLSGNPTSSLTSHTDLTSPEISEISNYFLEEFADELAHITFPPGNDDLPFDAESDLRELEYLLNHDLIKEMNSILEDSVDENSLDEYLVDSISEMFTDEHSFDYSSPPLWDDDNLFDLEPDNDYVYDDPFDSKEEKIKESKLLIDELNELDPPRSSDLLPFLECDSVFYEVDALPSTDNEDKIFNPGILIHENIFEVTNLATPDKNVKKLTNTSLIREDFNPPLYELPFHKEVPGLG